MISIGDIMFSFFIHIFVDIIILMTVFHIFNKKEITILETLVLLFIFNIIIFVLDKELNILYTLLGSLVIIAIYYLYMFLYNKEISKVNLEDKVFINRGVVNFHELIKENYTYENLLYSLKKRGINNPSSVDYCIKKNNDLIIFRKNSIKNYPISLIIDGKILKDNLMSINKSYEWIINKIYENNLELKDINYAYFKNKDVFFITN